MGDVHLFGHFLKQQGSFSGLIIACVCHDSVSVACLECEHLPPRNQIDLRAWESADENRQRAVDERAIR